MCSQKWAIITLSKDGVDLAERLVKRLEDKDCTIYTKEKYAKEDMKIIKSDITTFMGRMMKGYDMLCCIMAAGIVVRAIAPFLGHKSEDPGILVMDAHGDYVVSLLSGHLGGANDAARLVAKRFDAKAVITTGTDVKGSMAVDVLAEKIQCTIDDFTDAKDITALILNGEAIGIINQGNINFKNIVLPSNIEVLSDHSNLKKYAGVIITSREIEKTSVKIPAVKLVPKKIVLGVGCRRDTPGKKIILAIQSTLASIQLSDKGIKAFATIGLKENELGIQEACDYFKAKKMIIPDEMVQMVQSRFEASDFVFQTTGLYAVSEPCGYIASGFGTCLLEKQKLNGITLSVWIEEN
ncbi:MAG: cobalt-precorrin 5A hydrolase [Acetobacterium sp.]